jgi:hypothetical protein
MYPEVHTYLEHMATHPLGVYFCLMDGVIPWISRHLLILLSSSSLPCAVETHTELLLLAPLAPCTPVVSCHSHTHTSLFAIAITSHPFPITPPLVVNSSTPTPAPTSNPI